MAYLLLASAILLEVAATASLRMAVSGGGRRWYAAVSAGYVSAFALLALVLAHGVPLGVAYGIWAATGVALTATVSRFVFREPLTRTMVVGIVLIIVGVLLIELGASH